MSPDLVELIKKYKDHPEFLGIEITDVDQPGAGAFDNTLLHLASSRGDVGDVEHLVRSGADINKPGDLGYTPLQFAVMMGHRHCVALLLKLGANKTIKNEFQETAYDVARNGGYQDIAQSIRVGHGSNRGKGQR